MSTHKPLLIIVNGLPASGKTTLSKHLAHALNLPLFSRDAIYENIYDALACATNGVPPMLGAAAYSFMYHAAESVLTAGQPAIIEAFFGRPDLRTAELLDLQRRAPFQPFQILCKADGALLVERVMARASARHAAFADLSWLEQGKERLLRGDLSPLTLDGQLIEVDTTTPADIDYDTLLRQIRTAL